MSWAVPLMKHLDRRDDRVIIHFDYDCFYASVFEAENPALRSQPLAVQQKQIIVTCNYEARRRGLRKLQLITEAKHVCPDVVIVLGEDLTRFRDASKALYNFIRAFSWSDKAERLGFDEVWMDVTDMVDYNMELLNQNDLANSFFCLSKEDPTRGFAFNASQLAGHGFPSSTDPVTLLLRQDVQRLLTQRLLLGSHLAMHVRLAMEEEKGYTSTVGISTSRLLSKLVGNVNKPKGQTTLLPPYSADSPLGDNNVNAFLDDHDIGAVPYIGFKVAQKLREHVLGRDADFSRGLVYGPTKEKVKVGHVRKSEDINPEMLEKLLAAPGMPHGLGLKVFQLVHGVDHSEVATARNAPRQISIEDSYIRLDTFDQLLKELHSLTKRLVERMRIDLMNGDEWIARPTSLRLTTRPRQPLNADGTRTRSFNRISRSGPVPTFIFNHDDRSEALASRVVQGSLLPMFRRLHPEKAGWNLSLVNVAVTGMEEKRGLGSDIGNMFKKQEDVRKEWESEVLPFVDDHEDAIEARTNAIPPSSNAVVEDAAATTDPPAEPWNQDAWEDDDDDAAAIHATYVCPICLDTVPFFAKSAHDRFHDDG